MTSQLQPLPGIPYPFGVTRTEQGHNFALYSKHAEKVRLLIYDEPAGNPLYEVVFDPDFNRTGEVWHLQLQGLKESFFYTYKVSGPWSPEKGLLFNDSIQLLDPYTRVISGLEKWNERLPGQQMLNFFQSIEYDWEGDKPLNRALNETIIYEVHVRGYTRHTSSGVQYPGTYRGLIEKIDYIKDLGVTAIELLPIHEFDETDCKYVNPITNQKLVNYWGYSSLGFFAVKSAYASNGRESQAAIEFRDMVKAFHKAGIEVLLDVVFNHTAEGGFDRPIFNFKGLENSVYYQLDETCDYLNHSGCGNTLNCNHPVVRKMILDSLRYFVAELHVDGFRFDLASILTRDENGEVLSNPPLLEEIANDPILANTKLIAEAWDASGLYQVGSFPASRRWAEWNDKYRDLIRRFCLGEQGLTAELATRISGSEDLYKHSDRKPFHSINFVVAHDGFTMMDLVSYQQKHNLENGEDGLDGENRNFSMNFGIEGESADLKIREKRMKQIRNMATILLLSQGTPMMLSGDEFGNSQQGNNNAWCQDNEITWLDWGLIKANRQLLLFWQKLISFRKEHPSLRRRRFFTGEINPNSHLPDISWHNSKAFHPDFDQASTSLAFMIDCMEGDGKIGELIYIAMNFSNAAIDFELPIKPVESPWQLVLDTSDANTFIKGTLQPLNPQQATILVTPFSIKLLKKSYNPALDSIVSP